MLIVFAFFAEQAQDPTNSKDLTMSQEAMAVFAFFLFLVYASIGSMFAIFRLDIIKEGKRSLHTHRRRFYSHFSCASLIEIPSQDPNDFDVQPNEPAAEDDNQI